MTRIILECVMESFYNYIFEILTFLIFENFQKKKQFIWILKSLKKKSEKNLQFFFRTPKFQNKKIRNKQNFE